MRYFTAKDRFGNETEFELVSPNMTIETEGQRQYSIAYGRALVEGVMPRQKMAAAMKDQEIWTDENELELKTLSLQIAAEQKLLLEAERKGEEDACKESAENLNKLRIQLLEIFMMQQSVFVNSAEAIAEAIKAECIMAACTRIKINGKRYWKNYKEFIEERDENETSEVYEKVIELQNLLLDEQRQSIVEEYPETKYLNGEIRSELQESEEDNSTELETGVEEGSTETVTVD
jgi:hypothetical protein